MVWIDQTSHDISISQTLIQSKVLAQFNSMNTKRGEEAAEEKLEARRGWFMRFKEKQSSKCSCRNCNKLPRDLAKIIYEGGYTEQQIFNVG